MFFRQLTFDKKRLKILVMVKFNKMKEFFNKLALVTMLAGSVLSFNSCGDKEQIHGGNPVEDQCVHCDDEKNDNSCVNGSECGYGYTDERLHTIGNGNYQFRDFMYGVMVNDMAVSAVNDAKSYMNVMMGDFEKSLEGNSSAQAYFADYIKNMKTIDYSINYNVGIDLVINDINNHSKPIFVDIIRNLDPLDRDRYIVYHQALNADVYGSKNVNINDDVNQNYNKEKEIIQRRWTNWNKDGKPFEIVFDDNGLTHESAVDITNAMDALHDKAATKMGNGLTGEMLSNVTNNALSVPSLDRVHDVMGNALDSHKSCAPVESEITIVEAMNKEATKLLELEQANYNNITNEYSK